MVEPFDAVVTDGAVGGPGRPEDLACEAVLQFHRLISDQHLLRARGRPVRRSVPAVRLDLDLALSVPGLVFRGAGNDS